MTPQQPSMTQRFARAMARTPHRAALRIAIIYAILGCAWILISDFAVDAAVSNDFASRARIHTLKGGLFILVTAAMLYVLIRRAFRVIRHYDRARRDIENQTRLLVERVRDYAIFTLDAAGNVTSWNRGAQQIFDWSEQDVIGENFAMFYNEVDVQAGKPKRDLDLAAAEGWDEQEIVRVRQDGSHFWASAMLTALREGDLTTESGPVTGYLVLVRDITERRRTQEALQRLNQTLAAVIDNSPLAIVTLNNDQKVMSWNVAAERLFGWSASDVVGNRPPMIPEWRQTTFESNNRKLLAGERISAMEVPGMKQDGTLIDVSLWAAPLTDDLDKVIGNVRIYADMSDRNRAEQEIRQLNENLERRVKERTARLEEANEELQAFSYTVSHDLRIPLKSLQAIARDLVEHHSTGLDDEGKSDALRVVGAAARMESQIEELLEFSRVSRDQLQLEPVSLVLIFHELLGRLERDEMLKNAEITVTEPLGWVLAHRLTLQQVVLNLLVNALTFVRPGVRPAVNIRADQRDGTVSLCIEDNGIGIDEADRDRVFHVFERLPAAEAYPGIGVGLTVARRGVERMGGRITVTASRDHGTTFIIELPASKRGGAR